MCKLPPNYEHVSSNEFKFTFEALDCTKLGWKEALLNSPDDAPFIPVKLGTSLDLNLDMNDPIDPPAGLTCPPVELSITDLPSFATLLKSKLTITPESVKQVGSYQIKIDFSRGGPQKLLTIKLLITQDETDTEVAAAEAEATA